MESEKAYQARELDTFLNQKHSYFDTIKEFSDTLEDAVWVYEQLTWIENGSYGAGACFALQKQVQGLSSRCNKNARIGQIFLHALYGKPFTRWNKLSDKAQKAVDKAVSKWLKRKTHSFAQELII